MKIIAFVLSITGLTLSAQTISTSPAAAGLVTNARGKALAGTKRNASAADFSALTVQTLNNDMPKNGGYGAGGGAGANLRKAVMWNEEAKRLDINPSIAKPIFCSGACYLLLVKTLQNWEKSGAGKLTPEAWKQLAVRAQADGVGVWGRANANGPGFSKLVHDLKAGVNFTDINQARPGDVLKFFWSEEIGAKERGHIVIYLGHYVKGGVKYITYWSANKPDGYSVRHMEASKMHHFIFTRITNPQNFNNVVSLPKEDKWLKDMLSKSFSYEEVCAKVGAKITAKPAAKPTAKPAPKPAAKKGK